ncbi:MAG TPA: 4Fe-4S dicluster domain-containing protein [bacterium]|nr:4Fe-4S dicluster domain-containing protein [bacterium]
MEAAIQRIVASGGVGAEVEALPPNRHSVKWAKVIDHTRCIGCHACTTACKSENDVPLSVTRTYVKHVDVGVFPDVRRAFQVTRCNQCEDAPCVTACPTSAMYRRTDGIVDFDKNICIGCKACIAACPYDAIFINPDDHSAEKCNFCAHRLDIGLEPACVVVCPTEAILVGDLDDSASRVAQIVRAESVRVRRPEKQTLPKLYYKGAGDATLDPIAARRPDGGLFMWSEQLRGAQQITSGAPAGWTSSSAAALLSYDAPHQAPWGWRVSLYTWTKSIAAGAYLVALLLAAAGVLRGTSPVWRWGAPGIAAAALALTGVLLVADLKHPARFYLIFTRPQWRSWLVRGAFLIAAYGIVLVLDILAGIGGRAALQRGLAIPGAVAAVLTAVYTAFLFAQARARDLWESPSLGPHLGVQALLAGAAVLVPCAGWLDPTLLRPLLVTVAVVGAAHLAFVWAEAAGRRVTPHGGLAVHELVGGRYRAAFWFGVAASVLGVLAAGAFGLGAKMAPGAVAVTAFLALAGLLVYDHAYVQAGQAVPLA